MGKLKPNKLWRRRQLKRPRIRTGGFYFSRRFAARSRALRARISRPSSALPLVRPARQNRHATQATGNKNVRPPLENIPLTGHEHLPQTWFVQRPKYRLTGWKGYILTARAVWKSSAALRNESTRSNSATPFCGERPLHHPMIRDVKRSSAQLLAVATGNTLVNKQWVEHTKPSSWLEVTVLAALGYLLFRISFWSLKQFAFEFIDRIVALTVQILSYYIV